MQNLSPETKAYLTSIQTQLQHANESLLKVNPKSAVCHLQEARRTLEKLNAYSRCCFTKSPF